MSLNSKTDGHRITRSYVAMGLKRNSLNSQNDGHINWSSNAAKFSTYSSQGNETSHANKYSCNKTINDYVVAMREANQNISRADLAKLPDEYMRPVFRSLSNENKVRIFTEKINLLIATEKFSQEEISHLRGLLTFFRPEYYNEGHIDFIDAFFQNWINVAMLNFKWDKRKIGLYIATPLTPTEFILQDQANGNSNSDSHEVANMPEAPGCSCSSQSNWCIIHAFESYCGNGGCQQGSGGCGTLMAYPCSGLCYAGPPPHIRYSNIYRLH